MVEQVAPGDFAAWAQRALAADGQPPLLLDVREPFEWQLASIAPPQAQLLQLPMHEVPRQLASLSPQRPVAVLCHHGGRSMQVAWFLAQHGFEQVANIRGGIDAWAAVDPTLPRY